MSSRRPLRVAVSAAAVVTVGSLARADAPMGQYGFFNQASETIYDNFTLLTWQRSAPSQTFTFLGAASYCASLSGDAGTAWRVPSYKELLTLVDESPHVDYVTGQMVAIDRYAFPSTLSDQPYLTSSPVPGMATYEYVVDFSTGIAVQGKQGSSFYVRCVHD
jgi:hypothetical protein